MADIAGIVEDAIVARLDDDTLGFNARFTEIQTIKATYGALDPPIFDFSDTSTNFNRGRVQIAQLIASSPESFPYIMVDVARGANAQGGQLLSFMEYSGGVVVEIEVFVSFLQDGVTDFNTLPNAVVGAMEAVFNTTTAPPYFGSGINYNGGFAFQKSPAVFGAENWYRSILFTLQFSVVE
jgi:hypothetical protein